ncbi:MAG TPA: sulfur oxidation c-type cytochrome SoxX [Burkholderiales bacterium]|nr:sulfur oxidation c-type cytochrome SoxX [Burkholderiales bacterium]
MRKLLLGLLLGWAAPALAQQAAYEVAGDAIPGPLAAEPGDPVRGRSIVVNRDQGGCTLCHEVAGETRFGNVAPPLAGVGAKLSPGQLRLRVADSTRVNPDTPMPAYYRTEGLRQVAPAYRGKPILSAQQVEDVVAWLATLKKEGK